MLKRYSFIAFVLFLNCGFAQLTSSEYEAQVIGGKEQVEQVLQTQLTLPKVLLSSNFDEHVTIFFDLDSIGQATHITFKSSYNNALRKETARILRFFKFKHTQNTLYETYPYSFTYHITTEKYSKFLKQRSKLNLKKPLPADSSYVIHGRAQRSPEYYKNGDEGLTEFILSEIEYPKLAVEKSVEGTVVVEFVVETNGYVTGLNVKQSLGAGCTEEALRLVKLTKWQPAVLDNKYVRYKTTYPITFSLRNNSRDASSTSGQ